MSKAPRLRQSPSDETAKHPFFNRGERAFFSVQRKQESDAQTDALIMRQVDESPILQDSPVFYAISAPDHGSDDVVLNSELASGLNSVQQGMIRTICQKMEEIRLAIRSGFVWPDIENEDLLIGETEVLGDQTLVQQRNQVLNEVIMGLANIIDLIVSGEYEVEESDGLASYYYLAAIFFETQRDVITYGTYAQSATIERHPLMGDRFLPWMQGAHPTGVIYEPHDYIRFFPIGGSVLPPGTVEWYTPVHNICGSSTSVEEIEIPAAHRRVTEYWIHLPDPIHRPTIIDGLFRGAPPSSLYLRPPGEPGERLEGIGDSYPLMQEGEQYFYMQEERQINLPNITSQYPQLR